MNYLTKRVLANLKYKYQFLLEGYNLVNRIILYNIKKYLLYFNYLIISYDFYNHIFPSEEHYHVLKGGWSRNLIYVIIDKILLQSPVNTMKKIIVFKY